MATANLHAMVTFDVSGDGVAIDFANTADWHAAETPIESLTSYDRLVAWGRSAGLLGEADASALLDRADQRRREAAAALATALRLREAIYHLFAAVAHQSSAPPADLAILNDALPGALTRLRLDQLRDEERFIWAWQVNGDDLLWFLAPVVRGAAEILASPDVVNLRECAGHPCGWIFLDHSRNHTRRWCSMAGCGNRAKAKRHYQRTKATQLALPPGE